MPVEQREAEPLAVRRQLRDEVPEEPVVRVVSPALWEVAELLEPKPLAVALAGLRVPVAAWQADEAEVILPFSSPSLGSSHSARRCASRNREPG